VRVARSLTPREVRLEDVPEPVCGPGEVLCRVVACGVCGSDVSEAWVARKVPVVLGHELVGVVEAVGADLPAGVPGVGETVVIHHHAPCGQCRRCRRGHETLCDRFRATALDPGGFADKVRVPADLVSELLPIGRLDAERASFVEPLACVLRALDRTGLAPGETLLVVGAGTSGLLAVAAARRAARAACSSASRAPRAGRWPSSSAAWRTPARRPTSRSSARRPRRRSPTASPPSGPRRPLPLRAARARRDARARLWPVHGRDRDHAATRRARDMRAALALVASGRSTRAAGHPPPRPGRDRPALELQRTGEAVKALVLP
jgi:L-iditol 2-dehydrogenase